jgi:hypothetical protein
MGQDWFYGEEHFTPSAENSAALAAENRQKSSHIKVTESRTCTGSIGCVGISTSGGALVGTYLGISNSTHRSMLHLGNCTAPGSAPIIIFGKNL